MIEEYCETCEEVVVGRPVYCEEHGYECGLVVCVQCGMTLHDDNDVMQDGKESLMILP